MKGIAVDSVLPSVAEMLGRTPAQVALRWGLQQGQSVLPKSVSEARLKENMDLFGWSIPEELCAKLSEIEQASASNLSAVSSAENSFTCVFISYAIPDE
jgi:diketogulonate reductase-like aldo/keto reductase